ncbi:MAG TPA: hydrolase 1, exosortase A system-associated, partial [Lamprocystis sp. (in: g-proteobacteria)]|nr:hydrolase 1, exosortase A system-associated [Lamprocystis sp. (in: g-proteobacteria)]
AGLVLLNPWVRTEAGEAKAFLRHYYTKRLVSRVFWSKFFSGGVQLGRSLRALLGFLRSAKGATPGGLIAEPTGETAGWPNPDATNAPGHAPLPQRMLRGLSSFRGPVLLILSGNDLTAKEFEGLLKADRSWSRWVKQALVTRRDLADADHTFSTAQWRAQVETWTLAWLRSW